MAGAEVVNANAEVGDPWGGQARREKQEGQKHQERDTIEDTEKKGQAGKQSKKRLSVAWDKAPWTRSRSGNHLQVWG